MSRFLVNNICAYYSNFERNPSYKNSFDFLLDEADVEELQDKGMKPAAIAGIVIGVILIVLITIDLFCCFFNSCGFLFCCHQALCVRASSKKKDSCK